MRQPGALCGVPTMDRHAVRWFDTPRPLDSIGDEWRALYRRDRYLTRLSDLDLDLRMGDLVSNLMVLGDDRKYRPQFHIGADRVYRPVRGLDFLRRTVEAWEEARLRGRESSLFSESRNTIRIAERLADEPWCNRPDWVARSRLNPERYQAPEMIFRFNPIKGRNRQFLERGAYYISAASSYNDSGLNWGRRDDELTTVWYDSARNAQEFQVTDYYCMCFSTTYDYRLYPDFGAQSCVAIHDPPEFFERLKRAIGGHNAMGADPHIVRVESAPIMYTDPFFLLQPTDPMEVHFVKHFRYAYQAELRYVLLPRGSGTLKPFPVEIGSLTDIAELVESPTGPDSTQK
jgi:hypothetical protein